jgi:ABC-type phosphate/phosphonate transport system substrate-binding protein
MSIKQKILSISSCLVICYLLLLTQIFAQNEIKITHANLGYSKLVFQDTNPRDANAAIFIWAETLKRNLYEQYHIRGELVPSIYNSTEELEAGLRRKEINILVITTPEYFVLKERYNLIPAIAGVLNESIYSQYVLLVRSDANIYNISDLKQKTIAQPKERSNPLVDIWLNNLLLKNKKPAKDIFFSNVKLDKKESNAVYSVFFKKADCTIVQRSTYNTLCTLNPQFKQSLKIIDASPDLVQHITVYRKDSDEEIIKLFLELAKTIHQTSEGQNIVRIFKSTKVIGITEKDLLSTKHLIDEYKKNIKSIK